MLFRRMRLKIDNDKPDATDAADPGEKIKVFDDCVVSSSQVIEPPFWAVPARGEAMLEVSLFPYCDNFHLSCSQKYVF